MARSFNGSSDAGTLTIDLSPYLVISISAWVNWTAFANNDKLMMEYTTNTANYKGLIIDPNESSTGKFVFGDRNGGSVWLDGFTRPSAGVFHHYGFVLDRATPINKAYVDGAPQSLTQVSLRTLTPGDTFANDKLYIMSRAAGSLFGAGSMADLAIWGLELTANEFAGLAKGNRPYNINRTLIFYSPIDGLASPEPDLSGNKRNIVLAGTAYANGPPMTMFTPRWPINYQLPPPSFIPAWAAQSNLPVIGAGTL